MRSDKLHLKTNYLTKIGLLRFEHSVKYQSIFLGQLWLLKCGIHSAKSTKTATLFSLKKTKSGKSYTGGKYITKCFKNSSEELLRDFENKANKYGKNITGCP